MSLLDGKQGVVLGIANKNSIAWGIAQALHAEGARLAFNFLNGRMEPKVRALTETLEGSIAAACDVTDDEQIDRFFETVARAFDGKLDFLIHSLAFAQRSDLEGRFVDTSRAGFSTALDISVYSLVAVTHRAKPMLMAAGGGSVMTMTFYGSQKVIGSYNVMGVAKSALEASVRYLASDLGQDNIRVNSISAGPVNTLSARGIRNFRLLMQIGADKSPMKRNITTEEVGQTAVFLASDLSSGITGENIYVDAGYHIMGA